MSEHPEANARWENQLIEFQRSNAYRELGGINGEPIEFDWIFPVFTGCRCSTTLVGQRKL